MRYAMKLVAASVVAALAAGTSYSATFSVNLAGTASGFNSYTFEFNHDHYDSHDLGLTGLDSSNAITVSQGDVIDATVTLDMAFTIPASPDHTDFLLFLTGSTFPAENTGVTGTFNFYDGGALVKSFTYGSATSGQLANYAALFPPNNTAFTFDSFTDDFTITDLAQSATLDGSSLSYSIVSPGAVPEPASWAMMVGGFGMLGGALRRRGRAMLARATMRG